MVCKYEMVIFDTQLNHTPSLERSVGIVLGLSLADVDVPL